MGRTQPARSSIAGRHHGRGSLPAGTAVLFRSGACNAGDAPCARSWRPPRAQRLERDNPGKLKYGAPAGIYTHFAGEFFKIKTGTDILFVPYKGGAAAITDVIGGHNGHGFHPQDHLAPEF